MQPAIRPSEEARTEELDEASEKIITITIRREIQVGKGDRARALPESHTLAVNLLTMLDKLAVRKATGLPWEAFWGNETIGEDSLLVLWWLARRKNGEAVLSFQEASAQWPADLSADDFDLHIGPVEDDATDPEA